MIRKYAGDKKLEKGEQICTATRTCVVRADGEKARIVKDNLYIVSGYYDCFDEPVEIVTEAEETEDE